MIVDGKLSPRLYAVATLCAIVALFSSPASFGQSMNATGSPCTGPSSTWETATCFAKADKAADRDLNIFYSRIKKVLAPDEIVALEQAERLWVQYRDATCKAERALYGSGTGGSPTYLACLAAETQARRESLMRSYGWRVEKFEAVSNQHGGAP